MEMWKGICEWFWDPAVWLPPNATWAMLEDRTDGVYYPDFYDLWITIPLTLFLLVARYFWERYIAWPAGKYFQVSEARPRQALPNPILDQAFKKHHKVLPSHKIVEGLAKQLDWSVRQVERWWRRRRVQGKASEMTRFRETSWRFLMYVIAFWSGLYILWDKPWLWDTKFFWYSYPMQPLPADCQWYYLLEMSLYLSLASSLMLDYKRKDFVENAIHHVVTISLIVVSWTGNMTRIGTVVLVTHDAVDYLLELAKLFNYIKWQKLCDTMFVLFTVVWFLTRILFYPFWIIRSSLFEGHVIIGCFTNIYYMYNGLLLALQVLHIIWFTMILRMVYAYIVVGKAEKDARSESETATNSEDDFVSYKPGLQGDTCKDLSDGKSSQRSSAHGQSRQNSSKVNGPTTSTGERSDVVNNNLLNNALPSVNGVAVAASGLKSRTKQELD